MRNNRFGGTFGSIAPTAQKYFYWGKVLMCSHVWRVEERNSENAMVLAAFGLKLSSA